MVANRLASTKQKLLQAGSSSLHEKKKRLEQVVTKKFKE